MAERVEQVLRVDVFRALSEPNRLKALSVLLSESKPCTVGEVAGHCPTDFSVTSRHLNTLKQAGIVDASKRGKRVFYSVNEDFLIDFFDSCRRIMQSFLPEVAVTPVTSPAQKVPKRKGNPPKGVPGIYG